MSGDTLETLEWEPDDHHSTWGTGGAPAHPADADRFEELGCIGRGGMGEVWRIHDRILDRYLVRKVLRPDKADDPRAVRRFLNEARITATLQHPGVIPVHDIGLLDDGRPFYTMAEVRGPRLDDVLREAHRTGEPPRRRVAILQRIADVLALAHSRGILHRDLKPENIMVGEFGSVIVLDWGIAVARPPLGVDEFRGQVVGTPAYMAPEMAAGETVGPQADVFMLGALLGHALTGRPPRAGATVDQLVMARDLPLAALPEDMDDGLRALHRRAIEPAPHDRFRDAGAFADALSAWLDGVERRERAQLFVTEANAHAIQRDQLQSRVAALRTEAERHLDGLRSFDPADRKKPGWRLQDAATRVEASANLADAQLEQALQAALRVDPTLDDAHRALADLYRRRLEQRGPDHPDAPGLELRLATHDRGEHAAWLRGEAFLDVLTEPEGATVQLARITSVDRRQVPVHERCLGTTPLRRFPLQHGAYQLTITHPQHAPVTVPVHLTRDSHWNQRPSDAEQPVPIVLPALETHDDTLAYVPAGPFTSGGDPLAADGLPARTWWVDSFVIGRHPVTQADYLTFLNALVDDGRSQDAHSYAPTLGAVDALHAPPIVARDGRFHLASPTPTHPIVGISWSCATAYCRWLADRTGLPWRLPHSVEWEKAARGVDGRPLPWGHHLEPTWAGILEAFDGTPELSPITAFPTDTGPYGLQGALGNVRDFCADRYHRTGPGPGLRPPPVDPTPDDEWRLVKGGNATSSQALVRPAARLAARPDQRFTLVGFRIARSM